MISVFAKVFENQDIYCQTIVFDKKGDERWKRGRKENEDEHSSKIDRKI